MGGPPRPNFNSDGDGGTVEAAPIRLTNPVVNLWRVLHVGFRNILSLSEDHQLPHLSDELSMLRMDIMGLFEMRRPDSGKISSRGFTYY